MVVTRVIIIQIIMVNTMAPVMVTMTEQILEIKILTIGET
jgi:hypothetical protein